VVRGGFLAEGNLSKKALKEGWEVSRQSRQRMPRLGMTIAAMWGPFWRGLL
jgi:hypothetical protein